MHAQLSGGEGRTRNGAVPVPCHLLLVMYRAAWVCCAMAVSFVCGTVLCCDFAGGHAVRAVQSEDQKAADELAGEVEKKAAVADEAEGEEKAE